MTRVCKATKLHADDIRVEALVPGGVQDRHPGSVGAFASSTTLFFRRHAAFLSYVASSADRADLSRFSYSIHLTSAPTETKFSTKFGWALRIGSASKIIDSPSIADATIRSEIATRMI